MLFTVVILLRVHSLGYPVLFTQFLASVYSLANIRESGCEALSRQAATFPIAISSFHRHLFLSLTSTYFGVNLYSSLKNMWRIFRFQARCFKYSGGFSRHIVTARELETFQEQGVVCLRGVFGEWIEKLATGIAKNQANPSKFSERLTTEGSTRSFYFNDYFNWRQIPEFREFVYKSPAGEIAGKLMEAEVCFCPAQGKR